MLIVDDIAGTDPVGADKNFLVHARSEKVDRDEWRPCSLSFRPELLAEQHLEALKRGVLGRGNCISDDLGVKHEDTSVNRVKKCGCLLGQIR